MYFDLASEISEVSVIAKGSGLRRVRELEEAYGRSKWRKLKGIAQVRLRDGSEVSAEIHWYEAHGIGSREQKIKRFFD